MKYISVIECNGNRLLLLILCMRMGVGLVIAVLVCIYEMGFVQGALKVLVPWDASIEATGSRKFLSHIVVP